MADQMCVLYRWITLLITGLLSVATAVDVEINSEYTIECPLAEPFEYPTWTGPATLTSPLTNGMEIKEPGMEWVNNTHLKILSVQTKHTGQYKCTDGEREGLALPVNVLTYDVDVKFLNAQKEEGTNRERVEGEINKEITVKCEVSGGNPAPVVTFTFEDGVDNPPEINTPTITQEMQATNTYTVNAEVTFTAVSEFDYKNITCSASYTGKDPVEADVLLYLIFPPTLYGSTVHQFPSIETPQMVVSCDTTSRPETTFVWDIDSENITASDLAVTEDYQGCTQNSTTHMYFCMSNITISDIKKEDNGKVIKCDYVFQSEKVKTSPEKKIILPFNPSSVTISGNGTGVVDSSGSTTLTLTCSADSAIPSATLKWYMGTSKETELTSSYTPVETEGVYEGKNVSLEIDIVANKSMNGEAISCCAGLNLCTNVTLNIQYPPQLLAPQLAEYRAYTGSNVSIPCIADSSPPAYIAWYSVEGDNSTQLSNNTNNATNVFYLHIVNITMSNAVQYECKAWSQAQDISQAVSKSTTLVVLERPTDPVVETTFDANNYYIEIKTSATAPTIPRKFYIQYRKKDDMSWLEVEKGYDDTLPGQDPVTYSHEFSKNDLTPDTSYEFRVKAVDEYGLVTYTATSMLKTDSAVVTSEDEMVSMTKYRNAIIISVFATAGLFLIILTILACALKSGKCGASSSKSYVM